MNADYLEFEQPIADLQYKLAELQQFSKQSDIDLADEIKKLETKLQQLTQSIFAELSDWQTAQVARHPRRPYSKDYIEQIFTDFHQLHGDRHYGDDAAITAGLARLNGQAVMIIGQEKGRDTKSKLRHNFGMPRPEGYRKALRLMKLAERFGLPVITFIDTPGAYPGIGAEERGQSEAIARNLYEMAQLNVPTIACVIGEGGSGGALAIGVADRVLMLQYSMYSVISPEGCASILWRSAEKASEAAAAMQVTAKKLHNIGLIDAIVNEPLGGAHSNPEQMMQLLKSSLTQELDALLALSAEERLSKRMDKLRHYGQFSEA